jgi:uncharacterized repeat protein (TIGR01451 family)
VARRGPSPLLYVRFNGTPGGRVTVYRGDQGGPREFDFPVTLGFRPGYVYRVKIDHLPGQQQPIYPTLEVRGSLYLSPQVNPADYPVPFNTDGTEVERIFQGVFVSKVVYLEHPDSAAPAATRPGQLLERTLPPGDDLLEEARQYGRPMVVVRVGERPVSAAELTAAAIPGTVLLPAEKTLMPPRVPPFIPCLPVTPFDPVLGPRPPEEECLQDGGDCGRPAAIGAGGRLEGLDPTDTVAEYTDSRGRRHVTPSNRICLCVPRFAAVRSELPLAGYETRLAPANAAEAARQIALGMRVPSAEAHLWDHLTAYRMKQRPSAAVSETGVGRLLKLEVLNAIHVYEGPALALATPGVVQLTEVERLKLAKQVMFARTFRNRIAPTTVGTSEGAAVVGRVEGLGLYTATEETCDVTAICEPPQLVVEKPMHLVKWADRQAAEVGDVVTFYLKYSNCGGKPIEDVAVSDSLTGRLEYVAGSAKTDRNAVFTMQQNEAGSMILRWEVSGKLMPGQSGVISFQARARNAKQVKQVTAFSHSLPLTALSLLITLTLSDIGDENVGGVTVMWGENLGGF